MIELLAPAGSPKSFLSAISAGADAVYLGTGSFNARQRAKNFTMHDLGVLTNYAHKNGRKVYLALNTLIKQKELPLAFETISNAYSIGIDAFIIQDLGIYKLIKDNFPKAIIHASTQMTVHNSAGVNELSRLGFSRAILARELTLSEIREIKRRTSLELEIFVHGALCFSISGACFASSIIGGFSGNRGLCTQPCRRIWNSEGNNKFFFSTLDLDASSKLQDFLELGISSLKIEGRMKSSEYVYRAVRYWRNLLDKKPLEDSSIDEYSRKKTSYYLNGLEGQIIDSSSQGSVGVLAGRVASNENGMLKIKAHIPFSIENTLRICNEKNDNPHLIQPTEILKDGKAVNYINTGETCSIRCQHGKSGDFVYIAGKTIPELSRLEKQLEKIYSQAKYVRITNKKRNSSKKIFRPAKKPPLLYIKLKSVDDLQKLGRLNFNFLILPLSKDSRTYIKKISFPRNKVIFELPAFITEDELQDIQKNIDFLLKNGYSRFIANNIGHFNILPKSAIIYAGQFLYAINTEAKKQFEQMKVQAYFLSPEDDFLNMRNNFNDFSADCIYTLYSYPQAFLTRAQSPHFFNNGSNFSLEGFNFFTSKNNYYTEIVSAKPYSIMQHIKKLREIYPAGFLLDLYHEMNFEPVLKAYNEELPIEGSFKYNFKRELK